MAKIDYSKYGGQIEESDIDYSKYGGTPEDEAPEMVDTFLGKMPKHIPELTPGTPEFKDQIEDLIETFGGSPGMKVIGSGVIKGPGILKNIFQSAFKNEAPYEEAATKASQEYEEAKKASQVPKPGLYRTPMSELQDIEHQIGTHINAEAEHGIRAAHGIKSRVRDIEDFWSDAYKQIEDKIKDIKFQMPEQAKENLGFDTESIMSRLKQGADPKKVIQIMEKEKAADENPYLKNLLSKAPTSEDSNAIDFMAKHRDFKGAMGGLKADLKSKHYGSVEKGKIREAIQKGKEMEDQIKSVLDQGLGEFKPEYDWVMKGYSEQVHPLRENPVVKAAKKGKMSDNIIKDLRTNESGMDVLRGIVKQDPEILRNIVGQRYMAKPSSIHAPNELTREFLDEMPEFKNLLARREDALKRAAEREDITLKQKIDVENKLKEIKEAKAKNIKKLWMGGTGIGAAIGIPYGYGKISKVFAGD